MRCCGTTIKDLDKIRLKLEGAYFSSTDEDNLSGASEQVLKTTRPCDEEKQTDVSESHRRHMLWANRFLRPSEVAVHNTADDCWMSWNGAIRDLTPVISQFAGTEAADVILSEAGKDVSHWFDKQGNLRGCISIMSGIKNPYLARGVLPQTYEEFYPSGLQPNHIGIPWWKEDSYIVGYLTSNTRQISITNALAVTTANITVCEEDTMELILIRYLMFNDNASNYTWKYGGRILNMEKTMAQNDIPDYAKQFRQLGLPEDTYIPNIFLFYNDNI